MSFPKIDNIDIRKVTEDILLIHQKKTPFLFSCCDGLLILPKEGRNNSTLALDLNIEPKYVKIVNNRYGPVSNYVCTHAHVDHTCHVHAWEEHGAIIHAPNPEAKYLIDLHNFYRGFGFDEAMDYASVVKFGELNGFQNCKRVNSFEPGESLKFENLCVNTISFPGHSKAHIGFFLPKEKVFHISCLGFDKPKPEIDAFGPWYGFKQASIEQYIKDINRAESIFLNDAKCLTSSHSYIVKNPDTHPFEYMRTKIEINQKEVDQALKTSDSMKISEDEAVRKLLKMDLFFPKKKLKAFLLEIYTLWESWIIRKHIQRSKYFNK
ncbi:MAG: MBL fold metallo-hydrolase [Promethearchaeota archaeon]|nr:MAG: MBL fold metallo-hydrolase [Candidatus Lokiarchaeota archaeon]